MTREERKEQADMRDEYYAMEERLTALEEAQDRTRQALDHAMKGDMDPEDRVIIAQILAGVGEDGEG